MRQREFCCLFSSKKITVLSPVSLRDRSSLQTVTSNASPGLAPQTLIILLSDWSCSSAQPGATCPGALSGQHSPNLWSGYPCLGSYTHSQFNALPTLPLKSHAHVCSWPCSQEMVMHPQETPPMSQRGAVPLQSSVQC